MKVNKLYFEILAKRSKIFFAYRVLLICLNVFSSVVLVIFPRYFFDSIVEDGSHEELMMKRGPIIICTSMYKNRAPFYRYTDRQ